MVRVSVEKIAFTGQRIEHLMLVVVIFANTK